MVTIRAAQADDHPRLVELAGELGYRLDPRDAPPRLAALRAIGGEVFVAEATGRILGWMQVGIAPALVEARTARILGLVVAATARGGGVGRALVAAAERWARRRGASGLSLTSNVIRREAHGFYEHLGFERVKSQYVFSKTLADEKTGRSGPPSRTEAELLFHVSERGDIERFEPRPPPSTSGGVVEPAVWAVGASRLYNYLVPRDCPRLSFHAGPGTSEADRRFWLESAGVGAGVVIETAWWPRLSTERLFLYTLPAASFRLADVGAAYYVSPTAVEPLAVRPLGDLPTALAEQGTELRVVRSLWPLHDAILRSSLGYSFIRLHFAAPREPSGIAAAGEPAEAGG
jgi:GNAT superfamily N-acetyltransferase